MHELALLVERSEPECATHSSRRYATTFDGPREVGVSEEGVRALVDAGMSIGFHTRGHHVLPPLDDEALNGAFDDGRAELEKAVGAPLTVVAYPHGRADERVANAARRAGFTTGYTGSPVPVRANDDPLLLGRLTPSYRSARHLAAEVAAALIRGARG